MNAQAVVSPLLSDRYVLYGEIASGGMASVQYGRILGAAGFARTVAIKRLHPQFAREPEFVSMFIDEARICARLSHANLVPTLDVLEAPGELALVLEYVHGVSLESLLALMRSSGQQVPLKVATALVAGVLHGLHAAHQARGEQGELLHVIHRDVSPQNVLVGADGIPRVLDFGIAKARGRLRTTPSGEIKGKLSYMAPEQFTSGEIDHRVDIYSASAVLWEVLAGRTLFAGGSESNVVYKVLNDVVPAPSTLREDIPPELDAIVLRGLSRQPDGRFESAREMACALEQTPGAASQFEVSEWLLRVAGGVLAERSERLRQLQQAVEGRGDSVPPSQGGGTRRVVAASAEEEPAPAADQPVTVVRTRSHVRRALLAAILLCVLLGAYWRLVGSRQEPKLNVSPAQPAPAHAPAAQSPSMPVPPETREDDQLRSPAADDREDASPAPVEAVRAKQERKKGHGASGKKKIVDCTQPYVIDPIGVKRWKPECL